MNWKQKKKKHDEKEMRNLTASSIKLHNLALIRDGRFVEYELIKILWTIIMRLSLASRQI